MGIPFALKPICELRQQIYFGGGSPWPLLSSEHPLQHIVCIRTKIFLESSGRRILPLETSGCRPPPPSSAHPLMAQIEKIFSELKVQIKEKWKPGLKPASKKLLGALNDIVMFIQNSFDVYYI